MPPLPASISRRTALRRFASGFGMLGLAGLLREDFVSSALAAGDLPGLPAPHFAPKAKRVIFLFMSGGPSHVDLFDYKPKLAEYAGKPLPQSRPDVAIGEGVAYLAPDRKIGGGVMTMSARENLTLPDLKPFWKGGIVRRKPEKARTKEWFERLSVRPANATEEPLSIFSGGNQQKILFGKWLSQKPSVFLLDEPTQGVDVGAKSDLHRELVGAAQEGAAVLISSSDLEELADLCDRVVVIVDGKISGVLEGAQLTQGAITRSFMPLAAEPVEKS